MQLKESGENVPGLISKQSGHRPFQSLHTSLPMKKKLSVHSLNPSCGNFPDDNQPIWNLL